MRRVGRKASMGRLFHVRPSAAPVIRAVTLMAAATCLFGVVACAAATRTSELRIVVELVEPTDDGTAVAREASRLAQLPARHLAAVSPSRHALVLACGDAAACEQGLQRLRAAGSRFASVEIDARKTRH